MITAEIEPYPASTRLRMVQPMQAISVLLWMPRASRNITRAIITASVDVYCLVYPAPAEASAWLPVWAVCPAVSPVAAPSSGRSATGWFANRYSVHFRV